MHGAIFLALAAAASALPATLHQRGDIIDSNLFVCPGDTPYGGCALQGNPYYVNESKTGTVVADLLGIWECPTTYDLSTVTVLCCSGFSNDGDYDYSTWCDSPRTTSLSTTALLNGVDALVSSDSDLDQVLAELQDALEDLDLETAEAELEAATKDLDISVLEAALEDLTTEISAAELAADLEKVTEAL